MRKDDKPKEPTVFFDDERYVKEVLDAIPAKVPEAREDRRERPKDKDGESELGKHSERKRGGQRSGKFKDQEKSSASEKVEHKWQPKSGQAVEYVPKKQLVKK